MLSFTRATLYISFLITSAPKSPKSIVQNGPDNTLVKSTTFSRSCVKPPFLLPCLHGPYLLVNWIPFLWLDSG